MRLQELSSPDFPVCPWIRCKLQITTKSSLPSKLNIPSSLQQLSDFLTIWRSSGLFAQAAPPQIIQITYKHIRGWTRPLKNQPAPKDWFREDLVLSIFCETSPSCKYSMRALWRLIQQPKPCSKEIIWLAWRRWEPPSSDIIHGTNPCRARWTSGPWWVDHRWTRDQDEKDRKGTTPSPRDWKMPIQRGFIR